MSSLMTSPSSSAPASAWSVNQVKKLSGSSCCLFLPALFCVWLERLVRSCEEPENAWMIHRAHKVNANIWFKNQECIYRLLYNRWAGNKTEWPKISITFLPFWWIRPYLSWFPFDFCRLWRRVSALIQMEFFGKYFVFKVRIFIKILKDKIDISKKLKKKNLLRNLK